MQKKKIKVFFVPYTKWCSEITPSNAGGMMGDKIKPMQFQVNCVQGKHLLYSLSSPPNAFVYIGSLQDTEYKVPNEHPTYSLSQVMRISRQQDSDSAPSIMALHALEKMGKMVISMTPYPAPSFVSHSPTLRRAME